MFPAIASRGYGVAPMAKLINVSNRLPVTVGEDKIAKSSGGLVAALEGLDKGQYEPLWLGWPGGDARRVPGLP